MKPVGFILVLGVALLAGAVGAGTVVALSSKAAPLAASGESAAATPRDKEAPRAVSPPAMVTVGSDTQAEVEGLRLRVEELSREVAGLRSDVSRQVAPTSADLKTPGSVDEVAALQRDAVVKIMADEQARQQAKRDEERKARELAGYAQIAERAAKELGLGPVDQTKLVDFMAASGTKRDDMFKTARESGAPEGFRTAMEDFRVWRETELQTQFGADLAKQLTDYARTQGRDGMGMGFGGGPGGDWGGGGAAGATPGQGGQAGQTSQGQTRGRRSGGGGGN